MRGNALPRFYSAAHAVTAIRGGMGAGKSLKKYFLIIWLQLLKKIA